MISLRSLSLKSKWVRALMAGTFFLLINPQNIHSIEPATIAAAIGYTMAAGSFGMLWKGENLLNWWYGKQPEKETTARGFDPNCRKCIEEKYHSLIAPVVSVTPSAQAPIIVKPELPVPVKTTATQMPETRASQLIINNHTTNITASTGSTIIAAPEIAAAHVPIPTPSPAPVQTIQAAVQTQTVEPAPQQPVHIIEPVQTIKTIDQPPAITAQPQHDANLPITQIIRDRFQDFYQNHYGKVGMAAAAAGYVYTLYCVSSLQHYLRNPKRISFWFSEYDLNKLLLLEFDHMQELLIQEFISTYNVSDQKSLKPAVMSFLNDMETELESLNRLQNITGGINTVSSLIENCCSPCCYLARSVIPFAGVVLDHIPLVTLNNLFFVNSALKTTIQERISRIHYYKNIFLQSTIVV